MSLSIWEGNKAQELIDAVKNSHGSGGIPDSVKNALLICFDNVAWSNTHGPALYNTIRDALYPEYSAGNEWLWHYKNSGAGNAVLGGFGAACRNVYGDFVYRGYVGIVPATSVTKRRSIYALSGVYPILDANTLEPTEYYPIPIPPTATRFILDSKEELLCRCIICKYTNDDATYKYTQVEQTSVEINQTLPLVHNFTSDEDLYMTVVLSKTDNSDFDGETEPEISLMFE